MHWKRGACVRVRACVCVREGCGWLGRGAYPHHIERQRLHRQVPGILRDRKGKPVS